MRLRGRGSEEHTEGEKGVGGRRKNNSMIKQEEEQVRKERRDTWRNNDEKD